MGCAEAEEGFFLPWRPLQPAWRCMLRRISGTWLFYCGRKEVFLLLVRSRLAFKPLQTIYAQF